nr:toll/interleukin-1 receptor domain-containing protein [Actinoplanes sp. L3-i22]
MCASPQDQYASWLRYHLSEKFNGRHEVFWDSLDIQPGQNQVWEIHSAIEHNDVTLMVLSETYLEGLKADPVWAAAFGEFQQSPAKRFITVLPQDLRVGGMLSATKSLPVYGLSETDTLDAVMAAIEGRPAPRGQPPTFPDDHLDRTQPMLRPLDRAIPTTWRAELDRNKSRARPPAFELHLVPADDHFPVLALTSFDDTAEILARHGAASGLFPPGLSLRSRTDEVVRAGDPPTTDIACLVVGASPAEVPGLAVTRSGQWSAWAPVTPRDDVVLLDQPGAAAQIRELLGVLVSLDLRAGPHVGLAVGVEPAQLLARSHGTRLRFPHQRIEPIRVPVETTISRQWLLSAPGPVSDLLASRLVQEYERAVNRV